MWRSVENPAASCKHGAGPIVVKMLTEMGGRGGCGKGVRHGHVDTAGTERNKKFNVKAGIPVKRPFRRFLKNSADR